MRIAVTGTPGVGKTTLCSGLGFEIETVQNLAASHGLLGPVDAADGAAPVDIDGLREVDLPETICIDGHLSHLLDVDAVVLIRCHPEVLRSRLEAREYTLAKIDANVESELLGVIAAECLNQPCLELDSAIGIEAMNAAVAAWVADGFKPSRPNEAIDWIDRLHGDD